MRILQFIKEIAKMTILLLIFFLIGIFILAYVINIIPHKKYNGEHFKIDTYTSKKDKDKDGIDDQTDILKNAKEYVATKPKYKSKYYESGYPNDEYGVCTDVVGFALKGAGYDLRNLVNKDIKKNKKDYNLEKIDKNIDFRRVENLNIYFRHKAKSLTTDIHDIEQWQGGDIVIFPHHIGIVSDKRNWQGVPFIIHNAGQISGQYEEDILGWWGDIIGHYRIS